MARESNSLPWYILGGNTEENNDLNWWLKLKKAQKCLNLWKRRHLTLMGKITILKTLTIPRLLFPLNFLDPPESFIKQCEATIYNCIWNNKDMVKRTTLIAPIEEGGLNMFDLESHVMACRAMWVSRILTGTGDWAIFGKQYINQFGPNNLILRCNFSEKKTFPLIQRIPKFYQNIIICFNTVKEATPIKDKETLLNQILWGNKHFTYYSKQSKSMETIFFKNWIDSGIITLNSLRIVKGHLDADFIYQKVKNKQNIYCEILCIQTVLKPYMYILKNMNNTPSVLDNFYQVDDIKLTQTLSLKTKSFYEIIKRKRITPPYQEQKWRQITGASDLKFNNIYNLKIKNIPENKLCEFNFKMLHLILLCCLNLKCWGHRNFDTSQICDVTHDIPHLLFHCVKAKKAWEKFCQACNQRITLKHIFTPSRDNNMCFVVSLFSYLIFKEWVKYNEHNTWMNNNILLFIKWNLKYKCDIHHELGGQWEKICPILQNIIFCIDNVVDV